jgi:hypothetical protein
MGEPRDRMGMARTLIPVGKVPVELLARLLGDVGPMPGEVLLGPTVGEDACALDLPAGVLVVATDPITLTGRDIGHHAVIVKGAIRLGRGRQDWLARDPPSIVPPGTVGLQQGAHPLCPRTRSGPP